MTMQYRLRTRLLAVLVASVSIGGVGFDADCSAVPVADGSAVTAAEALVRGSAIFPDVIPLPAGFAPEGIAVGKGTTFFVGSLANGSIYRGDLRTGAGAVLASPPDERIAVGLAYSVRSNLLFVAGGATGQAYVYDADSGEDVAVYELVDPAVESFINDVIVTREAAYFTNSFAAVLYRVPLGAGGRLPGASDVETIPLGGDFQQVGGFNANGIEATPDGGHLIVVNTTLGTLYRVDPASGDADLIDLGGDSVPAGDGLLLDGRTLYVVQNQLNQVAVVALSPDHSSGEITGVITSDDFDVPTTVAHHGNRLYLVNARFGTPVAPGTTYDVVAVDKR